MQRDTELVCKFHLPKESTKSYSSGSSRRTKTNSSSGSNSSKSSKERAVEEKTKAAELIAEAEFLPTEALGRK